MNDSGLVGRLKSKNTTRLRDDGKSPSEFCSHVAADRNRVMLMSPFSKSSAAAAWRPPEATEKKDVFQIWQAYVQSCSQSPCLPFPGISPHMHNPLFITFYSFFFPLLLFLPPSLSPSPALYICPLILGSAEKLLKSPMKYV